jgi:thioredoxin reductase (NADPH)
VRDRPNICPCEHHHEEIRRDGYCKCVLFVGDDYDPKVAYAPLDGSEPMTEARSIRERWVTVYLTRWCAMSRRAKSLLQSHGVPFDEVDIEADRAAARQVEAWNNGNRSVPTILIRQIITEPRTAELESVLRARGAVVTRCIANITQWCAQSRRALRWLEEQGIDAQVVDVESDPEAAERVKQWNHGNLSVPTLDVTLRMTEPTSRALEAALGLSK